MKKEEVFCRKEVNYLAGEKSDLDEKIELLNQELVTKTTKERGNGQDEIGNENDYAYYLKQKLLNEYDFLLHMKGDMDKMIVIFET